MINHAQALQAICSGTHSCVATADQIQQICQPLFNYFGLTSLVYQRNYIDGSEIRLSNQPKWVNHFYQGQYHTHSVFEKSPKLYRPGFVLWSQLQNHRAVLQAAREHNIDHGLTFTIPQDDGLELFFLGTSPDRPEVTDFCLNNIDLLQRFFSYFKDKASDLIKYAYQERILIEDKIEQVQVVPDTVLYQSTSQNRKRELFLQQTQFNRYYLNDSYSGTYLSAREYEVAEYLLMGKTSKEVAKQLGLSPRTVEDHINHLKAKLDCYTKSELVGVLYNVLPNRR